MLLNMEPRKSNQIGMRCASFCILLNVFVYRGWEYRICYYGRQKLEQWNYEEEEIEWLQISCLVQSWTLLRALKYSVYSRMELEILLQLGCVGIVKSLRLHCLVFACIMANS